MYFILNAMIKIKETFSVLSSTGKDFQNQMLRKHGTEFVNMKIYSIFQELPVVLKHVSK
jgi:hypothetical protein